MTKHPGIRTSDRHTLSPVPERSRLLTHAANTLREAIAEERYPDDIMAKAEPTLRTFSNATLRRIQNHPWNAGSARVFVLNIDNRWDETEANDYLAVIASFNQDEQHGVHGDVFLVWWYFYTEMHPATNNSAYPEERLSQLLALYRITRYIEENKGTDLNLYWFKDSSDTADELKEFILRPGAGYKREDIVDAISTHDTLNVDRIKAILNNAAPSLRKGVL